MPADGADAPGSDGQVFVVQTSASGVVGQGDGPPAGDDDKERS